MIVLFTAKAVAVWGTFLARRGCLGISLSAILLDPGKVDSCNLAQMCSISGDVNKYISRSVHKYEF